MKMKDNIGENDMTEARKTIGTWVIARSRTCKSITKNDVAKIIEMTEAENKTIEDAREIESTTATINQSCLARNDNTDEWGFASLKEFN